MMAGPEGAAAAQLYNLSPYTVPPPLIRCTALVKIAAARCNRDLGYLSGEQAGAIIAAARSLYALKDEAIRTAVPLDAYQGGAGTSINMAVNEWIAQQASQKEAALQLDPHTQVNMHQSTNDVMPTALRLMMHDMLYDLERRCELLQGVLQEGEQKYDHHLKMGRTQLRDAVVTTYGKQYATWAIAVSRDRWRCFKARERIREINLGGTAIGSGAGAPRQYVLQVHRYLQEEVAHPISRAEHLSEATSNCDQIVEAMDAPKCLAVNLRRIASDIRLMASGPQCGFGELVIPELLPGSSIMAGKVNPVIPEAVVQTAERVLANDILITRLAAMSELELNAFLPAISHTVFESLYLMNAASTALAGYLPLLQPDHRTAGLRSRQSDAVGLLPLISYRDCNLLLACAGTAGQTLPEFLVEREVLSPEDARAVFSADNKLSLGYDEQLYSQLRARCWQSLTALVQECRSLKESSSRQESQPRLQEELLQEESS